MKTCLFFIIIVLILMGCDHQGHIQKQQIEQYKQQIAILSRKKSQDAHQLYLLNYNQKIYQSIFHPAQGTEVASALQLVQLENISSSTQVDSGGITEKTYTLVFSCDYRTLLETVNNIENLPIVHSVERISFNNVDKKTLKGDAKLEVTTYILPENVAIEYPLGNFVPVPQLQNLIAKDQNIFAHSGFSMGEIVKDPVNPQDANIPGETVAIKEEMDVEDIDWKQVPSETTEYQKTTSNLEQQQMLLASHIAELQRDIVVQKKPLEVLQQLRKQAYKVLQQKTRMGKRLYEFSLALMGHPIILRDFKMEKNQSVDGSMNYQFKGNAISVGENLNTAVNFSRSLEQQQIVKRFLLPQYKKTTAHGGSFEFALQVVLKRIVK